MSNIDVQLSKSLADAVHRSRLLRKVADMCAQQLIWFMAGGFGLVVYYLSQAVVDSLVLRLLLGIVLSWAVTITLEYAIGRSRPFQEQSKRISIEMLWVPPSFPSGHATIAFAIAAATHALNDATLYGIALAFAILISIGRVGVRVHYLSDILAGAAVGTIVTSLVIHYL